MKNTNWKRLLSLLLVLAMIFAIAAFTASCGFDKDDDDDDEDEEIGGVNAERGRDEFIKQLGGVSETYKGAVSEGTYTSATAAANDYVAKEIVGEQHAVIQSTSSKGKLSSSQIADLNLPAEVSKGMREVEMLEVEYEVNETTAYTEQDGDIQLLAADKLNTTKKVTVYVIKYDNNWKYYSPCPVTGETISKSYYDSVFDSEKYKNCTYQTTMTMEAEVSGSASGESLDGTLEITMSQLIKYADGKIYMEQNVDFETDGIYDYISAGDLGVSNGKLCVYMETNQNGVMKCYIKQGENSDWYEGNLYSIGFTSIEQLTPFYDQYLDYTYFTKTDFGFTLQDENAQQYIEEVLSQLTALIQGDEWDLDMYSEYYVSNGVLSGMRTDAEVSVDIKESGMKMSIDETLEQRTTCTDYGTTVVTKPFS